MGSCTPSLSEPTVELSGSETVAGSLPSRTDSVSAAESKSPVVCTQSSRCLLCVTSGSFQARECQ
jgi:hypothetical protein